jgi:hypothetical protein
MNDNCLLCMIHSLSTYPSWGRHFSRRMDWAPQSRQFPTAVALTTGTGRAFPDVSDEECPTSRIRTDDLVAPGKESPPLPKKLSCKSGHSTKPPLHSTGNASGNVITNIPPRNVYTQWRILAGKYMPWCLNYKSEDDVDDNYDDLWRKSTGNMCTWNANKSWHASEK